MHLLVAVALAGPVGMLGREAGELSGEPEASLRLLWLRRIWAAELILSEIDC